MARASTGALAGDVLEVIRSQYDALEFLSEVARQRRPLTVSLIKQLHVALTRTQATYTATAMTRQRFEATLHHDQWKQHSSACRARRCGWLSDHPAATRRPTIGQPRAAWRLFAAFPLLAPGAIRRPIT